MGRKKKIEEHKPPTFKQFLMLFECCTKEVQEENLEILKRQPRPDTLCGENVPHNLNGLSYGQLDDLRMMNSKGDLDIAYKLSDIIFGKTLDLLNEDVNKVFGFMMFCAEELTRINKIFATLKPEYTNEEIQAGVEELNFGSFGVLDWYAKRMGITNQNDVRSVAWVRIFQCMKNDHAMQEYEKRLQDVYMHKGAK